MASTNSYLELLIQLGVDTDSSRNNIEQYIKTLKNLPKLKIELDVDNLSSANKGFSETNKIIEELQAQVKQLKKELDNIGGRSGGTSKLSNEIEGIADDVSRLRGNLEKPLPDIEIGGFDRVRREINTSVDSIEELEKLVKEFDGSIGFNYRWKNVKGQKGVKEEVLSTIDAMLKDDTGQIVTVRYKPKLDSEGEIEGLEELRRRVSDVDSKDFENKLLKLEERLRQMGRQGYISSEQMDKFYDGIEDAKFDKSISALDRINQKMTEFANKDLHDGKLKNAMASIKNDATKMISQLEMLNNIDGIDKSRLSKTVDALSGIKDATVQTDAELKALNVQFDNVEKGVKDFIKEGQRITKVNGEIEKLQTTIAKLQSQGSLSSNQVSGFLTDIKSIEKTTEAVKQLENQINKTANETTSAKKIANAMEGISPTVDRLNEKLDIMVNKLGGNVDVSKLEKIRSEIQAIDNTEIKTVDEIAKLNAQLSQTEKSITQLGVASNVSSRFEDQIRKVEKALSDLEQTGYSTEDTINEFKNTLKNIPIGDLAKVKSLLNEIDDEMSEIARNNKIADSVQKMLNELAKLDAQFDKTKNLYRRTFDRAEAEQVAKQFDVIRKSLEALPKDTKLITKKHLDDVANGLNQANISVKQFNANATTSVRNSLGIFESLKTAFEKFPVK